MGNKPARGMARTYWMIASLIDDGHSLNEIARFLNRENVPSARGGRWYASTVRAIRDSRFLAVQERSSSAKGDES
jgi:hypothetical protein